MCIAWHCQRVPTFAHQFHDLSKFMSSDSSCKQYSRMFHIISDTNNDITTHISLLLYEFSLKSSDLYRISPNTQSSFERWNSSAQLAIFDRL